MELIPLRPDQTDDGAFYDRLDADADRAHIQTRRIMLAIVALLLLGGLAVIVRTGRGGSDVAQPAAPKGRIVTGEVTVISYRNIDYFDSSTWCKATGGYSDVRQDAQVLVVDGAGATIATGSLGEGRLTNGKVACTFAFSISGVPKADFYQVKVNHRGGPTYSFTDMETNGWHVELTLG